MAQISLNLPDLEAERISLGEFLARPDAYSASDFTAKNKRFSELEVLIEKAKEREQLTQNLAEAKELAGGGDELADVFVSGFSAEETIGEFIGVGPDASKVISIGERLLEFGSCQGA